MSIGIHRCVGNRLAVLQILWEEMLHRRMKIEVMGEPSACRPISCTAIRALPVRIAA